MAVPQNALPLCGKVGRRGNTVRIRRKNAVDGRWYCGTVITVPYRMIVGAIQESPAAPAGRENPPMSNAEKTKGPASNHHVIASPQGRGNLPHSCRRLPEGELPRRGKRGHPGVRRLSAPRNDVVTLAGPSDLSGWLLVCGRAVLCTAGDADCHGPAGLAMTW